MVDSQQFISFCYLLFLQIAFINTKSQLFTLKNNKIVMSHNLEDLDEIFYIISTTEPQWGSNSNSWTKESDNYDFTIDVDMNGSDNKTTSSHTKFENEGKQTKDESLGDEILDCGKSVNLTLFDDLVGIANRKKHKISPEPDVLFTFTTKSKSSKLKKNFDVDALENKLRRAKRDKPRSVQLYNQIGNFHRIKGNALLSIECFRKALSINPTNSEVILNLARVLFHQGYLEDAIYLTRRSLEVHNADARATWRQYFTLGEIFKKYGNIQESILHLRHALELSPHHDKILSALDEIEKIPMSSLHFYTILIILLLVICVLIVMRYLNQDENAGTETETKPKRCFKIRGAMSKVRVIRRK